MIQAEQAMRKPQRPQALLLPLNNRHGHSQSLSKESTGDKFWTEMSRFL